MELIERSGFLDLLRTKYLIVAEGEGHCVLVTGESGIGKTSLIKTFCKERRNECNIYEGTCDALFTPRPLAPLYDIAAQMKSTIWKNTDHTVDRAELFSDFFHELQNQKGVTLLVIEDIHWADEATLDFIKFLARRITHLPCLFIVTYRDNEIHSLHPLRNVLGQLPPDSFTRLQLVPLSKTAVEKMAEEKGYKGEDVYSISGGNPFYVNEILASYSPGVPDNIKDSVLSVYNLTGEKTKQIWQLLSVLPTGFEIKYLEKMEPSYAASLHNCLDLQILIPKDGMLFFKHELFRRTIETSLSPLLRISLNKRILELFKESFEQNGEIERIIHHAKNANEYDLVVKYAPMAAKQAADLGAHIEAAKLLLSAIEYYQGHDPDLLIQFYESYAYECYLTGQLKEAIIYQEKALRTLTGKNNIEKIGDCMRFLSRLWWFEGKRMKAESYARQAIELMENQPSSKVKAMVFSNMSQLKMLSDERDECIFWGEKAIITAKEVADEETLSHALNNVGTVQMTIESSRQRGIELLQQSLEIALKNSYDEHAARAYTNLASAAVEMKDYLIAKKNLKDGIKYCEERNLGSWTTYLLGYTARLDFETGNWDEAYRIADNLIQNEDQLPIFKIGPLVIAGRIKMRRGDRDVLSLLIEAKEKAFETMEQQRIVPAMVALLEYEWITEKSLVVKPDLEAVIKLVENQGNVYENSEFAFWLLKARSQPLQLPEFFEGYKVDTPIMAARAAAIWRKLGCPYEEALSLFEGSDEEKRKAIEIVDKLGATAVFEKMKFLMRTTGIRQIPRGIRKTTRSNTAHLTKRELDILQLMKGGLQNKEIAQQLFISPKTVDHHISSILFKLDVNSRTKAVQEAVHREIIK